MAVGLLGLVWLLLELFEVVAEVGVLVMKTEGVGGGEEAEDEENGGDEGDEPGGEHVPL